MKETLVLMCLESHFDIIEGWQRILGNATNIIKENFKLFLLCGG